MNDLEVVESGVGDQLVVIVHGVLDRGRSFRAVAEDLAGEFRVAWYDRRGYGSSRDAPGAPVEVSGHVADLLRILDGRRALLLGHSFGGVTALGAAAAAPELVRGVALYETGMAWVPGWDDAGMGAVFADPDPEARGLRMMLRDRFDSMDEATRASWRREAAAFLAEEASVRTGVAPFDVAAVRAPVVYGRSDPTVMPAVPEFLDRQLARFEVVTIEGAGHHAHRTAPLSLAGLVRRAQELAGD